MTRPNVQHPQAHHGDLINKQLLNSQEAFKDVRQNTSIIFLYIVYSNENNENSENHITEHTDDKRESAGRRKINIAT